MVKLLFRKMLRDMKRSMATYLICIVIVATGFCGYSILLICFGDLSLSRDYFFEQTNYCDGFAVVEQAPLSVIKELQHIPGVKQVQRRIAKDVPVKGLASEEAHLQLLSIEENGMNHVYLDAGRLPARDLELVAGNGFYEGNHLKLGDKLTLSIQGANRQLTICGKGISPESIYMIEDMSQMLPSMDKYDAAFISYEDMASLYQMESMANQFLFSMIPGNEFDDIKDEVEDILDPYGVSRTYPSDEDMSVSVLKQEIDQLEKMSFAIPVFFLSVAAIILYIMLHRLLDQQRTQIGTLMAMGMSSLIIRIHYMCYGLLIGISGGLIGGILGNLAAGPLTEYYQIFFQLPNLTTGFYPMYLLQGMAMGGIFCGAVAWLCTGNVYKNTPAEALRPEAPKKVKRFILEKIPGFLSLFTVPGVIAVRSLARYKKRTFLSLFGIACAYMVTASLVSMNSLFDVFLFDELEKNQRQDISINFNTLIKENEALGSLQNNKIEAKEGVLAIGASLETPDAKEKLDVTIQAIDEDATLSRLYDADANEIRVKREGIVISEYMAQVLQVRAGDTIILKLTYPEEKRIPIPITDIMAQYMGSNAYMSKEAIGNISEYRDVVNRILLKAPTDIQEQLKEQFKDSPNTGTIVTRQEHIDQYRSMMGSIGAVMVALAGMGVLIGMAVIYTSSLIYYEELKREISTMMMLGLKSKECLDVVAVGQWILTIGGVILGIPMAMWASKVISTSMASDIFVIPDFVDAPSLLLSIGLIFIAVWFSSLLILHKLKKLAPVELLRERE
ncbi:MAG: ABC transporter permease [Lachnospiraceae bacterium]|nr:ABC transporter permease [Lachnospiraceae bacterium]